MSRVSDFVSNEHVTHEVVHIGEPRSIVAALGHSVVAHTLNALFTASALVLGYLFGKLVIYVYRLRRNGKTVKLI